MKTEEIESLVEAVTQNAFNVIKGAYDFQKESSHASDAQDVGTRIIFPQYGEHNQSNEVCRISEQELRFVFIEQLNKYLDEKGIGGVYYSVETPTKNAYKFSGKSKRKTSARTDLTIHTLRDGDFKRVCLIEFKGKNPKEKNYEKDITKLNNETCELKYFIQIVNNKSKSKDRISKLINSLINKTAKMREEGNTIHYRCYCLYPDEGKRLTEVELN